MAYHLTHSKTIRRDAIAELGGFGINITDHKATGDCRASFIAQIHAYAMIRKPKLIVVFGSDCMREVYAGPWDVVHVLPTESMNDTRGEDRAKASNLRFVSTRPELMAFIEKYNGEDTIVALSNSHYYFKAWSDMYKVSTLMFSIGHIYDPQGTIQSLGFGSK